MKTIFCIAVFAFSFSCRGAIDTDTVKPDSGKINKNIARIYLTADDFVNDRKMCSDSCELQKHKIRKHYIFHANYIDLVHGNERTRFHKDSIYAYRDNEGNTYRLYGKLRTEYRVIETGTILLYVTEERDFAYKHYVPVITYYFSAGYDAPVLPLTLQNIKYSFPDNYILHHYLNMEFSSKEIYAYDEENKMYRINYLLNKYRENK